MKKLLLFPTTIFVMLLLALVSCSDNLEESTPQLDLSNLNLEGLKITLSPIIVDLDEYPKDQLFKELGIELFESDMEGVANRMNLKGGLESYIGVSMVINGNEAIISPIEGEVEVFSEEGRMSNGDDSEICGGEEGDEWTSFGVCYTDTCVTEKMLAAADLFGEPGVGECLDLRIVRTRISARVCGRLIECI